MIPAIALALTLALPSELRWAGDAEGGAPFVEADPSHPVRLMTVHGLGYQLRTHDETRNDRFSA